MARHLYRFYLYFVYLAMLVFAAVALEQVLQPLLALTPLRGGYQSKPEYAVLVQASVFALVSWLIAFLLGGIHYWLIRRDMKNDPAASGSAIRSFFLNISELVIVPGIVGLFAFGVLAPLGREQALDVTFALALSIAGMMLFVVLEWERRRATPASGMAQIFQNVHFSGAHLLLLILLTFAWLDLIRQFVDAIFFQGSASGITPCGGFVACPQSNLLSQGAATFWLLLCWIGYGYRGRQERESRLRTIFSFVGFAYGVLFLITGVASGLELAFKRLLHVSLSASDMVYAPFASFLTFGLLVTAMSIHWLRRTAKAQSQDLATRSSIMTALGAFALAGCYWWGVGLVVLNALESLFPAGALPLPQDQARAFALALTGLAYLPASVLLSRRSMQSPNAALASWRGFLFALLGSAMVAGAIGVTTALYALLTALLHSPLDHWVHLARTGLVTGGVGGVVIAIYLWQALRAQRFDKQRKLSSLSPSPSQGAQMVPHPDIEEVLDQLLAGKITREEAARSIRFATGSLPKGRASKEEEMHSLSGKEEDTSTMSAT